MCALVGLCACIMRAVLVGGGEVWRAVVAYLLELLIEPRDEAILRKVPMAH